MATSFNNVKTNIPGVGERAYVFSMYRMYGGNCVPNPNNIGMQCMYLAGVGQGAQDTWGPNMPFNGLFPNVGEYISSTVNNQWTQCYKVLAIIDEATFMAGTCLDCYNNGYGGGCSDVFITTPPYPGDPNGCRYNNSINGTGIIMGAFNPGPSYVTYIQTACQSCTQGLPPTFEPNMVVNCCDPTETYQLDPIYTFSQVVIDTITGTGVNQIGVNNFTEAFRADLYTGGNNTGYKCWHLKEDYPPFGPTVYTITIDPVQKYPDCTDLDTNVISIGYDPCCITPPAYEWCCMTGVIHTWASTCVQVQAGNCQMGMANVSAGPFPTQQDCLNNPCGELPCPEWLNGEAMPGGQFGGDINCCEMLIGNLGNATLAMLQTHCDVYWSIANVGGTFADGNQLGTTLGWAECCPLPPLDDCEPPFAKLAKLTSKLDKFTKWKNKSLGK
jgi:hypothetical protein|tara:strand:+ start:718 stop:2043 length:1326 start_codon:yes stop_codon:yes gene_type:complete